MCLKNSLEPLFFWGGVFKSWTSFFRGGQHKVDGKWTRGEGGSKKAENGWTSFVQAPLVKGHSAFRKTLHCTRVIKELLLGYQVKKSLSLTIPAGRYISPQDEKEVVINVVRHQIRQVACNCFLGLICNSSDVSFLSNLQLWI